MNWTRLGIILIAISCNACALPIKQMPAPVVTDQHYTIYLVSHGWHAGIVIRRADITENLRAISEEFPDAYYLEIGWGDRDYYQTPDPHLGITLAAALLPTASVLHIVGFTDPVQSYFPHSEVISIEVWSTGFENLTDMIAASFAKDEANNIIPLGSGLYGNSYFYLSRERYHLFNTCNVWVARRLRAAGFPIRPIRAITVENLMSQARKFGKVVSGEDQ